MRPGMWMDEKRANDAHNEDVIRNTIIMPSGASLYSQNSLNTLWHGIHKMFETLLCDYCKISSGALSFCESLLLPPPKDVLLESDLVI